MYAQSILNVKMLDYRRVCISNHSFNTILNSKINLINLVVLA